MFNKLREQLSWWKCSLVDRNFRSECYSEEFRKFSVYIHFEEHTIYLSSQLIASLALKVTYC